MARHTKKSHHKKHTPKRRRRSRVGAISADSKSMLMTTLGGIAGAVVGSYVGNAVKNAMDKSESLSKYSEYGAAGVQIVGGMLLPKLIKSKTPVTNGLALGMTISGGLGLVKSLGVLPGVGNILNYKLPYVGAANMQPTIEDVRSVDVPFVGSMSRVYGAANMA